MAAVCIKQNRNKRVGPGQIFIADQSINQFFTGGIYSHFCNLRWSESQLREFSLSSLALGRDLHCRSDLNSEKLDQRWWKIPTIQLADCDIYTTCKLTCKAVFHNECNCEKALVFNNVIQMKPLPMFIYILMKWKLALDFAILESFENSFYEENQIDMKV